MYLSERKFFGSSPLLEKVAFMFRILQQQEQLSDRSRTGLSSSGTGLASSGTGLVKPPTVGQTARQCMKNISMMFMFSKATLPRVFLQ